MGRARAIEIDEDVESTITFMGSLNPVFCRRRTRLQVMRSRNPCSLLHATNLSHSIFPIHSIPFIPSIHPSPPRAIHIHVHSSHSIPSTTTHLFDCEYYENI